MLLIHLGVLRGVALLCVRIGIKRACAASDHFGENDVRADFYDSVPGNKYVVAGRYAFKKALFAGYYKALNRSARIENYIAYVPKFAPVGNIYYRLAAHIRKGILLYIHSRTVFGVSINYAKFLLLWCF